MKKSPPSKKHLMSALLRKADKRKSGEKFKPKMLLKRPSLYDIHGSHVRVTPAMYRRLHLGKRNKTEAKNGS